MADLKIRSKKLVGGSMQTVTKTFQNIEDSSTAVVSTFVTNYIDLLDSDQNEAYIVPTPIEVDIS